MGDLDDIISIADIWCDIYDSTEPDIRNTYSSTTPTKRTSSINIQQIELFSLLLLTLNPIRMTYLSELMFDHVNRTGLTRKKEYFNNLDYFSQLNQYAQERAIPNSGAGAEQLPNDTMPYLNNSKANSFKPSAPEENAPPSYSEATQSEPSAPEETAPPSYSEATQSEPSAPEENAPPSYSEATQFEPSAPEETAPPSYQEHSHRWRQTPTPLCNDTVNWQEAEQVSPPAYSAT